jgi:hypothetical protein
VVAASGATETATCPSGYVPTGEGYDAGVASINPPPGPVASPVEVTASYPTSTGWEVVYSSGGNPSDLLVYVICESP